MKRRIQLSISFTLCMIQGAVSVDIDRPLPSFGYNDNGRKTGEGSFLDGSQTKKAPNNLRKNLSSSSPDDEIISTDGIFSLSDCSSYDMKWILDLYNTCESGLIEENNGCQCEDAKLKIQNDEIVCEIGTTECPEDCPICFHCMKHLGCLE